ncbi:DUF3575 domain-containing protein [Bacteroides thetaiotaomicron]|uniref:DUF3575 domain-containing protein n=1 Tax=Bacteroides thetaiotaomicron TaxID=818 RepID=UPI001C38DD12|nr:DUF3575 domain-containing protein [Bacteroides thetaiotaomicron]MBV4310782.1 DUF3575 domain-containing protein [Bacteroides thetaiotaomicron]MBV4327131.1 DUF3575 domain-containing protein [Bacteroides thetaiotaomicron]MCB7384406.1 DUF3575 domain-containing protein [Bacteroides thetaiotaomicron]MCG4884154.1 DUF3575 domain-containing protein [Bacteroides thetaiotaomicron]MCQ5250336.1 DUF3575 domain-containing protein [Bacteroides thetaiotaomicron]
MNAWKTVLLCTLLAMVAAPMFAQATDKAPQVVFRFVEGNDMFYVPWNGNGTALDSLCRMIKPETLDKGSVKVDGYSDTKKLSMIRCNRVKSELITRKGLQEEHFTTTNNVGEWNGLKNVVFVTLPILYKVETEKRQETQRQDKPALTDSQKQSETAATSQEETTPVNETRQIAETTSSRTDNTDYGTLSLRANLLRWATLTPDLGIGWRINRNWSVQVNGTWTSWSWDGKNRRYALWEVSLEIRYYPGKMKRGYLGVMYHAGEFNYKLGDTGKQGDLMGGGLTGGYLLKLNRTLSLDFSLGIGCTHAEYEKYTVIDGVRVKQDKTDKNYWGVNRLGIGLVWNIF